MALVSSVAELVGNTPLLAAKNTQKRLSLKSNLFAKLELFNPAGSVKDRIAKAILAEAKAEGRLKAGGIVIEPTSGNTGIGIASIAAAQGYRAIIVMPDSMSAERRALIKAYGAQVVLTPGELGMQGAIEKAEELKRQNPGSIIAGQFTNPVNPQTHYRTTGPEILRDLGGKADIFVAGVGTGGTVSGIGAYLKEHNPSVQIVAVEPAASPVLSGGRSAKHGIEGIGAGFVPKTLNLAVIDTVMCVEEAEAVAAAKQFGKDEGILVGISSGAALAAAIKLAQREENTAKNIVVLLPDGADRYYSGSLFKD